MKEIGMKLFEARLAKGLSLQAVEERTKIGKRYLEALERGEFHRLPGDPYTKGFIRLYARTVDTDPEPLLEQYSAFVAVREAVGKKPPVSSNKPKGLMTWVNNTLQWFGL